MSGSSSSAIVPAAAPTEQWDPNDPVWGTCKHIERLAFMSVIPPVPPPPGMVIEKDHVGQYLAGLRNYSQTNVAPELLVDRQKIWDMDSQAIPPWMYLHAGGDAHKSFWRWKDLLTKDMKCDLRSCQKFVALTKEEPPEAPYGFMESSRILAHMLKDKIKKPDYYRDPEKEDDWSGFLAIACDEAMEALECPAEVKGLKIKSKGGWGEYEPEIPGPSSSSSSYQYRTQGLDKGKGKDMGKDKGDGYWYKQGHR